MCPRLLLVSLALAAAGPAAAADAPKKLLLIGSPPDDHAPATHEYMAGVDILAKCLKPVPGVEASVVKAEGAWKEGPELIGRSDAAVVFLTEGAKWVSADPARLAAFRNLADRGGGLVCLHWGMGTRAAEPVEPFVRLFGGCHGGPDRKYKVLETTVAPADPQHPAAAGVSAFTIRDEFYYRLKFAKPDGSVKPVLQAVIDGNKETVAWAWDRPDGGRSFGFSGLHYHETWKKAEYRRVVAQGVLWAVKLPVPEKGLTVELAESDYTLPRRK